MTGRRIAALMTNSKAIRFNFFMTIPTDSQKSRARPRASGCWRRHGEIGKPAVLLLKECVDERRDRRTLGQHQQHAKQNQRDHDWRQPIFFVLLHKLPEFAYDLYFRHVDSSKHFFIMAWVALPLRVRLPIRIAGGRAAMQRVPTGQAFDEANRRHEDKENEGEKN